MNDIATVVIELRSSSGSLQERTEAFDVNRDYPYEINVHMKQFIRTLTIFPTDQLVVRELEGESHE
jgi:hypothetical protein|tara:strand:+ start:4606 stop:4803 length:198 start_codon:yes stop_codon:yes gene_type:complete